MFTIRSRHPAVAALALVLAAGLATVLPGQLSQPAAAAGISPTSRGAPVGALGHDSSAVNKKGDDTPSFAPGTRPTTSALWNACGILDDHQKLVRGFSSVKATGRGRVSTPGSVWLRCGYEAGGKGFGYRHILANHITGEWEVFAEMIGGNWRDLMDFSVANCLREPGRTGYRASNDTFGYQCPIQLRRRNDSSVEATIYPFISVAARSHNIITVFAPTRYTIRDGVS